MIKASDEEWLKKALQGCSKNLFDTRKKNSDLLEDFRTIVGHFVKEVEKRFDEIWALWELEPASKELREKFYLLEDLLSYVRRFCEGKIEGKYQRE